MATNCVNCLMPSLSRLQVSMNRQFCQKCYKTAQYITGPCFGCRNAYTSDITSRTRRGHYCEACRAMYVENRRRRQQIEEEQRVLRTMQERERQIQMAEERRRQEEERRRREAEERRLEAERLEQERLEKERQYNAGIDNTTALDHRALCKMIYDMHIRMDQLHTTNVALQDTIDTMQETIDTMQETIESHRTDFWKVRHTANKCYSALDSHALLSDSDDEQ